MSDVRFVGDGYVFEIPIDASLFIERGYVVTVKSKTGVVKCRVAFLIYGHEWLRVEMQDEFWKRLDRRIDNISAKLDAVT